MDKAWWSSLAGAGPALLEAKRTEALDQRDDRIAALEAEVSRLRATPGARLVEAARESIYLLRQVDHDDAGPMSNTLESALAEVAPGPSDPTPRLVSPNDDKPHRCPACHRIPDSARESVYGTHVCDACRVSWTVGPREVPLPDAPGWWALEPEIVGMPPNLYRIVKADGSLCCGKMPLDRSDRSTRYFAGRRWYGPFPEFFATGRSAASTTGHVLTTPSESHR